MAASKTKVRNRKLVDGKQCKNCYNPTHLKFNFSFIVLDDNFTEEYQIKFLERIRELSKYTYLEVLSWPKEKGIEIEKLSLNKEIPPNFFSGESHRNFNDGKYAIFRLYPNNNPIVGRIIGRLINKVFYIFYIDIGGKLYKH